MTCDVQRAAPEARATLGAFAECPTCDGAACGDADPLFLGVATYGGERPDVGSLFGGQFAAPGYGLTVESLPPGVYDLIVYAHSTVTGTFNNAQVVRVTVR